MGPLWTPVKFMTRFLFWDVMNMDNVHKNIHGIGLERFAMFCWVYKTTNCIYAVERP